MVPSLLPDALGISAVVIAVHISLAKMFAKKMAWGREEGRGERGTISRCDAKWAFAENERCAVTQLYSPSTEIKVAPQHNLPLGGRRADGVTVIQLEPQQVEIRMKPGGIKATIGGGDKRHSQFPGLWEIVCSNNGFCECGKCSCNVGWTGERCAVSAPLPDGGIRRRRGDNGDGKFRRKGSDGGNAVGRTGEENDDGEEAPSTDAELLPTQADRTEEEADEEAPQSAAASAPFSSPLLSLLLSTTFLSFFFRPIEMSN
ncbi:hypothetical protein niasHT_032170 [Heterodera trifolii]|uniref:EGF-like domain-containing protein n=1 Tax=Heterodera trifolii TaxID=157864 RepID=A0ABD2HZT8_9BILA